MRKSVKDFIYNKGLILISIFLAVTILSILGLFLFSEDYDKGYIEGYKKGSDDREKGVWVNEITMSVDYSREKKSIIRSMQMDGSMDI